MSTKITCTTCGYTTTSRTVGLAEYGIRRHNCDKHLTEAADRNRRARARQERPVRDCHHPIAQHQHGTRAACVLDKCRCEPCTAASRKAEKQRQLRDEPAYVDTTEAVSHIKELQAAGLGWKRIAHLAGLEHSVIYPLLYGRPDRQEGRPRTQARPGTVRAILAVPMPKLEDLADGAKIDATGARRRLQALATLGWPVSRLAAQASIDRQALDQAMHGSLVFARTAKTVAALYDQLWNTPAPERDHRERQAAARARGHAHRNSWLPPLAWDDGDLDNPDATPADNTIPRRHRALHVEDVAFLLDLEPLATTRHIAERLDATSNALQTALKRAGRTDLLQRLARNAEVAA